MAERTGTIGRIWRHFDLKSADPLSMDKVDDAVGLYRPNGPRCCASTRNRRRRTAE
ncbi:hypothetical protein [Actinomadura rugatobispora]|uniref:Uncharacterized protein n=1 Tax=Actinomadura rugatobispora TaxID=1994 RepID=A0ABW1A144_9ACTN